MPTNKPPNKIDALDEPLDETEETGERPTLVPEFDPAAFARDSETRQRSAGGEPSLDEVRRLHEEGKDEDALFLVTRLLVLVPNDANATRLEAAIRAALERECWEAIGSESTVLACEFTPEEIKLFQLDNVSAFLLSLIDGVTPVEGLLDVCGVPRLLALRHLRGLVQRGIATPR